MCKEGASYQNGVVGIKPTELQGRRNSKEGKIGPTFEKNLNLSDVVDTHNGLYQCKKK